MKKFFGKFLQFIALGLILGTFSLLGILDEQLKTNPDYESVFTIAAIVVVGISTKLFFTGKKIYKSTITVNDTRPPVIYLRNFNSDRSTAKGKMDWMMRLNFFGGSPNLITEEEQLAFAMNQYGPFTGIGRPGENLPELGAARTYVDDDHWKEKVSKMISDASLVVFRASNSEGLLWELKTALEMKPVERILILVPENEKEYTGFEKLFFEISGIKIPQIDFSSESLHTFRGVIWFQKNKEAFCEMMVAGKLKSWLKYFIIGFSRMKPFIRNTAAAGLKKIMTSLEQDLGLKASHPPLASRKKRIYAALIDVAIIVLLTAVSSLIVPATFEIKGLKFYQDDAFALLFMLYILGFETIAPYSTPGKKIFNIYIADEQNIPPAIMQILFRLCIKIFSFCLFFGFYHLFTGKKFLHDSLMRTEVFEGG